jgi:hypothetical protein
MVVPRGPATVVKPGPAIHRRGQGSSKCLQNPEELMRGLGMVLLTGAAAVVAWKVIAALVAGLLGMALKVGLVILVVYFLVQLFNGKKAEEA